MQANVKTKNSKKLKVKALVDSGCTHTGIDKQLVKDKRIQTRLINFLFEVFNTNGTKNGEVTKVVSRSLTVNFIFIFSFHFILFLFFLFLLFSIFRTTQVRVYQLHCHISHKLMA